MFTDDLDLPYIIAEIGPNFAISRDPSVNQERLSRLIDVACVAGANAIKLQLKSRGPGGYYEREPAGKMDAVISDPLSPFKTRREYVDAREPDAALLAGVANYCGTRGLDWSASPWDVPSVELLASFPVPWVKVASASLTDVPLLHAVRAMNTRVILSTGMSELAEVDAAIEALGRMPTILHCVSTYPCPERDIDLRVMETLRSRYGTQIGWSGHERRVGDVCFPASALGAVVIERHLTYSREDWGPDHAASLEPGDFIELVRGCRTARRVALMGTGAKHITPSEVPARERLRRV